MCGFLEGGVHLTRFASEKVRLFSQLFQTMSTWSRAPDWVLLWDIGQQRNFQSEGKAKSQQSQEASRGGGGRGVSGDGELGLTLARPMLAGAPDVPSDPLTLSLSLQGAPESALLTPLVLQRGSLGTWDVECKEMSFVSLGRLQRAFPSLSLTTIRGVLPKETV